MYKHWVLHRFTWFPWPLQLLEPSSGDGAELSVLAVLGGFTVEVMRLSGNIL